MMRVKINNFNFNLLLLEDKNSFPFSNCYEIFDCDLEFIVFFQILIFDIIEIVLVMSSECTYENVNLSLSPGFHSVYPIPTVT